LNDPGSGVVRSGSGGIGIGDMDGSVSVAPAQCSAVEPSNSGSIALSPNPMQLRSSPQGDPVMDLVPDRSLNFRANSVDADHLGHGVPTPSQSPEMAVAAANQYKTANSTWNRPGPSRPSPPRTKASPLPERARTNISTARRPQRPVTLAPEGEPEEDLVIPSELTSEAQKLVNSGWRASQTATDFVSSVRLALGESEHKPVQSTEAGNVQASNLSCELDISAEAAILQVLLSRIVSAEAASSRLVSYLREMMVAGLVSSKGVLRAMIRAIGSSGNVSTRVEEALLKFLTQMLPWYCFSSQEHGFAQECRDFLTAIILILQRASRNPATAPIALEVIADERLLALTRAIGRREPALWGRLGPIIGDLLRSADKPLHGPLCRLKNGLGSGSSNPLQGLGIDFRVTAIPLREVLAVLLPAMSRVFVPGISDVFQGLWFQPESPQLDQSLLMKIENLCAQSSSGGQYSFRDRIRVCELAMKQLTQARSMVANETEEWVLQNWGDQQRISRLVWDILPQVKPNLRTENACLAVACAVIGSFIICFGGRWSSADCSPTNGCISEPNEEVEEICRELSNFSVTILEESATAEEAPSWRSFGLWLLLLASRAGCLLRESSYDMVHAARILRFWGLVGAGQSAPISLDPMVPPPMDPQAMMLVSSSVALSVVDAWDSTGSEAVIDVLSSDYVQ